MTGGVIAAASENPISVGDASGSPLSSVSAYLITSDPAATVIKANDSGWIRRIQMYMPSVQSNTFAFFTYDVANGNVRDITASITDSVVVGINEYNISPLQVVAGDVIGRWSSGLMSLSFKTLSGNSTAYRSSSTPKPTPGQSIVSLLSSGTGGCPMIQGWNV